MDIEDLVTLGQKHRFCPLYMARQLKGLADIVFMPYNYLLQPRTWKALGIDISNSYVIIDEAHNVEKICEESASLTIKSTDIALCIEEVSWVMTGLSEDLTITDTPKDITADELMQLKEVFLNFEKVFDEVEIGSESKTYDGDFLFEMLEKAGINFGMSNALVYWIEKSVQYLSVAQQSALTTRKGDGLELFADLLIIAFMDKTPEFKEKIKKCYKVHFMYDEPKKKKTGSAWLDKPTTTKKCRVMNYWCFNPGFGMGMLIRKGVKSIILTSGTLAPLPPLISELDLDIKVTLENPHIVNDNQVCVKVVSKGPDGELLNCSYQNRDSPKYIHSLGRSILSLSIIIPGGLLVFFSSYPIMQKCQEQWQEDGTWGLINQKKPIFVEPKSKQAFANAMTDYYKRINDPVYKAAIFMGVCRGKVAEGLDFADVNGRAVIITGLPYPPLKDPKIILKRRYLDTCCASNKQYLNGQEWYSLEAARAVNQAMGRVIRHKNDYGAILLLDSRFDSPSVKKNMSKWLRNRITSVNNFGQILPILRNFFREAQTILPVGAEKTKPSAISSIVDHDVSSKNQTAYDSEASSSSSTSENLVTIHKSGVFKRRKITLVSGPPKPSIVPKQENCKEYLAMAKRCLGDGLYKRFCGALNDYKTGEFSGFATHLNCIYRENRNLQIIMPGLRRYIKTEDKVSFELFWQKLM